MYTDYFGLTELPFSIAPDPRYLYMSERHREALAHLLYGLESNGAFILLTGDVGTGKTTVSRCLLEQIPQHTNLALVLNPKLSAIELLETICDELHIDTSSAASIKSFIDRINHYLLEQHAQGRNTVLLIEEAQNLDLDVLEQLRLLTNLETSERKLLQIILLGQPELKAMLARPELSQLAQRVTARFHLTPLSESELGAYVAHRLAVAGGRQPLFPLPVIHRLYRLSGGIPRLVNVLCDRALLGTYVQNRQQVNIKTLNRAALEVMGEGSAKVTRSIQKSVSLWASAAVMLLAVASVIWLGMGQYDHQSPLTQDVAVSLPETTQSSFSWPDENDRLRSNSLAYQSLFQQWGMTYSPEADGSPCFFAQTHGLACLKDQGSLETLQRLNRPVVLDLSDEQGRSYHATLTGLGKSQAQLTLANRDILIPIKDLHQYWYGHYTLLWRQPPGYERAIHPGHVGEEVIWLSQKLNQLSSEDKVTEQTVYQDELLHKVRQFQLAQGLVADGIVGVQTLIHINNATGLKAPVLSDKG
ncbi:MAG: AAA family ATPase [Gammaproteobacteria bacterium]|nr:AAA family ATPase [Gammaproteobacteria bacterium]